MNTIEYIKEQFDQLQSETKDGMLHAIRKNAFADFTKMGIPVRHEEWKYTRINGLFNKDYKFPASNPTRSLSTKDLESIHLPGYEQANELIFINGVFSTNLSLIRSASLQVTSLEEAAKNEYKDILFEHLGHSRNYLKDGINALNTAFVKDGVFVHVAKGKKLEHPVYIYNITDASAVSVSMPR